MKYTIVILLVMVLIISGCSIYTPPDGVSRESTYSGPLSIMRGPPVLSDYTSGTYSKDYTDAVNYYLLYIYAYTLILNRYSTGKGWVPPDNLPICRAFVWPKYHDLPKYIYTDDVNLGSIESELLVYITELKASHDTQRDIYELAEELQRSFCVY